MYAVMDVGCPDTGSEEQQLVRQEVHGNVEQRPAVRNRL
jgi:hypothetical protein